jgi:endoglucanase
MWMMSAVTRRRPLRPNRLARFGASAGVVLGLLVSVTTGATAASRSQDTGANAPRIRGWLHTNGQAVVDSSGRSVRFLGVGILELAPGSGRSAKQMGGTCLGWSEPTTEVYNNIHRWGFNVVRLAVTWANLEPKRPATTANGQKHHYWNSAYLAAVDRTIRAFTSRGVAVILEMAQYGWSPAFQERGDACPGRGMPAWLYEGTDMNTVDKAKKAFFQNRDGVQDAYSAAWRIMAKRYAGNRLVVGADMMNEPYMLQKDMAPEDMRLGALYQRVGAAIRKVNSRILLIFQDSQYNARGRYALQRPPSFRGVVYEFHLYTPDWNPDGKDEFWSFANRARAWKVPLYMGEFNAFGYGANGPYGNSKRANRNWQEETEALLATSKDERVGWTFWAYSGGNSLVEKDTGEPKPGLLPTLQGGF